MKIITVCGSLKFRNEIIRITEEMTLQGNCMLSIVYPTNSDIAVCAREGGELLGDIHKEKVRISDATLAMDINHCIRSSTQGEIEFARALVREIIYYTDIVGTM